ncbi:MAG TPA: SMI1/KNR4 family protein [Actinopolymorphaceae bacterium]
MTLAIVEANGPAGRGDLERVEALLGTPLPRQYRDFLLRIGGGQTDDLGVPGTGGDGVLQELCGTDDLVQLNQPSHRRSGFPAYVPDRYLFIGYGAGGAPCIRVKGGDEGSVWWADFEKAGGIPDEEPHEEIMIRLADDFDGFLALFD